MNLTESLVFIHEGSLLEESINIAIEDTCETIYANSYSTGNYRDYDTSRISSSGRNSDLELSFLKVFQKNNLSLDRCWTEKAYKIVVSSEDRELRKHGAQLLKELGIDIIYPKPISYQILRGLHIFFIALWARKAIQLPMSFPLPQTRIHPNRDKFNTYLIDNAYRLYPPILKIVRKPFQKNLVDNATPDLLEHIPLSGRGNYKYLAWRPIIASSWENIRDIKIEDVSAVIDELSYRKNNGGSYYPISANAWLKPLFSLSPSDFTFELSEFRQNRHRQLPTNVIYDPIYYTDTYSIQRDSWNIWISNYIQMIYDTGRVKRVHPTNSGLAELATYVLTTLPKYGVIPPRVEETTRAHLDGCCKAPPLRAMIKRRVVISHISHFFDFVLETLAASGVTFFNPITKYDRPFESRPPITNKRTFSFDEFRQFYALCYALLILIEHILYTFLTGESQADWEKTLLGFSSKNAILDTEEFGYSPIISYIDIFGKRHTIPIRFIPFELIGLEQLPIVEHGGQRYFRLPTPDAIASVITALETSIRFIHIRWLDRLLISKDYPELGDDYLAICNRDKELYFNLFVNTDKSGTPWVRPTSKRLLKVFSIVSNYKKLIASDHFDTPMKYTHHDLTHYPLITPLYCHNSKQTVLTETSYRKYYKLLIYFFNLIRFENGQQPVDEIPKEIKRLSTKADYQTAYNLRRNFTTDYTPHGIRATVISLSSTFLDDEHIGNNVSGHKEPSVSRYIVVNKKLVSDVSILMESKIISAISWSKMDACPAPASADQLLHSTFAIQTPSGEMLTREEILQKRHLLSTFSTHFCLASGNCPADIINSVGRMSCGQCYLALKSTGHLPAILAHTRSLAREIDEIKLRLKDNGNKFSDETLKKVESVYVSLINEFCAWSLTAQHILKNSKRVDGNFFTVSDEYCEVTLAEFSAPGILTDLVTRMSDAVTYPELANSSLKADIFKLSAKLMRLDSTFSSIFTLEEDQLIIAEMKGKLESLMIAIDFNPDLLEGLLQKDSIIIPSEISVL
ncbi:hypothetical protein [Pseudomonas oryzihabitans]|nr:hypothetical protein [Pseudomonas psychrotolerans]